MNSRAQSNFARALKHYGLYHQGCGIAAIHLLQSLEQEPMTHAERLRTSKKSQGASSMGVLIRSKLAVYEPGSQLYQITYNGAKWLQDLQSKGLMPETVIKEAA
jgi:hypothetical protein